MDLIKNLSKKLNRKPTAQDIQDEVFRSMTADQKSKITSKFSMFILDLNKAGQSYELPRIISSGRKDSKRL